MDATRRRIGSLGRLVNGVCSLVTVALLGSCAALDESVVLGHASAGRMELPLEGAYDVTGRAPFSGALSIRFNARPTADGFVASTRPGAAWSFVPGLARLLGPLFVPSLFPNGVILTWSSRLPTADGPGEGWIGVPGIKSLGLRTRTRSIDEPIELLNPDGKRVGVLEIAARPAESASTTDYRVLAASIADGVRSHLYDRDLAGSASVRAYLRQLEGVGSRARDDAEFVFGAVLAARSHLTINTPVMWRRVEASESSPFTDWGEDERSTLRVDYDERTRIATLRVDAFLEASEVDAAMRRVLDRSPRGLIVDLRRCPGVTLASLRLVAWLNDGTQEGPTLLGGGGRAHAEADPGAASVVTLRSLEDYAGVDGTLEREGCARIMIDPAGARFDGPVALLTGKRTSASAELLAAVLRDTGRARLFGQATAGRPIVSRPVDVGQGWVLWIAAWAGPVDSRESRTPTGPVEPDERCRDAKQRATAWLSASN